MSSKKRLDLTLVERGLAPSRERAQAMILAGNVLVGDEPVTKAGAPVAPEAEIRIRGADHGYVSRGALKLLGALDAFSVSVEGKTALDVGASTGGFTQVLLERGAARVIAVDVGHNQLAWSLRQDPRVRCIEKVNARSMSFETVGEKVDLLVADLSFISLEKVLPNLLQFASAEADGLMLIKPQFEVGREKVGKGGIVLDPRDRQEAVERVCRFAERELGLVRKGLRESPIQGTDGNVEFLVHWVFHSGAE